MAFLTSMKMRSVEGDVDVPAPGFGTWAFGDNSRSYNATLHALKTGYRHIDCAWHYGVSQYSQVEHGALKLLGTPMRLPAEFYDAKARKIIDRIVTEEEYVGYKENLEYRTLGIGALMEELVRRMVRNVEHTVARSTVPLGSLSAVDGDRSYCNYLQIALMACHDSSLAAILASLGALEGKNGSWPSYTASLAIELLVDKAHADTLPPEERKTEKSMSIGYVRIRCNDRSIPVPGCQRLGNHLEGNESFCTLVLHTESSS